MGVWKVAKLAPLRWSDLKIAPRVIRMLDHLMSQTVERVSPAQELLTSLTTVMVCNDVIRL